MDQNEEKIERYEREASNSKKGAKILGNYFESLSEKSSERSSLSTIDRHFSLLLQLNIVVFSIFLQTANINDLCNSFKCTTSHCARYVSVTLPLHSCMCRQLLDKPFLFDERERERESRRREDEERMGGREMEYNVKVLGKLTKKVLNRH